MEFDSLESVLFGSIQIASSGGSEGSSDNLAGIDDVEGGVGVSISKWGGSANFWDNVDGGLHISTAGWN